MINDARLAAPELTVDTLLRLLESGKISDRVWAEELINEAVRSADDVRNPVQLLPVMVEGVNVNKTMASAIGEAHSRKLDRLNLISRAVKLMIDIDPDKARQVLSDINGDLQLKPLTCGDNLTYQVRDIYVTVGAAAKVLFDTKEIADGRRGLFLLPWIENIQSPRQVAPVLLMLTNLDGPASEKQMLISGLQRVLARNFNDDRSFTSDIASSTTSLSMKIKPGAEPDASIAAILPIYRDYLVKNFRGTRCKDNEIANKDDLPANLASANKLFPQKPLTIDELTASDYDSATSFIDIVARSSAIRAMNQQIVLLRGKLVDGTYVHSTGPEWQAQVISFLESVMAWEGTAGETEVEMMTVRSAAFESVLRAINDPEFKKTVIRRYMVYLAQSPVQKSDFVSWYMWVGNIQKSDPEIFHQVADDLPNPNLAVMVKKAKLGL